MTDKLINGDNGKIFYAEELQMISIDNCALKIFLPEKEEQPLEKGGET